MYGALPRHQNISDAGITRIPRRNGVGRLLGRTRLRKVRTKRCNKQLPGHHIQMVVNFLTFIGLRGEKIRRFETSKRGRLRRSHYR